MARTSQRKRRRHTRESSATLISSSESDGGGSGSEDEREESEKQERRWQLRQSTLDRKGKGKEIVKEDGDGDEEESSSGGESAGEGNNGGQETEAQQQQEQQQLQSREDYVNNNNNKSATPREEICGICLSEGGNERGKLDCCDHFFCFACIMEWAKVESRCPLCKQRFVTVTRPPLPGVTRSRTRSIRIPTRDQVYEPSEEEIRLFSDPYQYTVCTECQEAGDEGLLLLCDRCDAAAHTYCVGLGRSVPRGDWFCQACQSLENESSGSEDEEDYLSFDTTDIDEEEGSGTDSLLAMLVGDVGPNFFRRRTLRSTANQRGAVPLRRSARRRGRRNSLSETTSIADASISMGSTPTRGYFPTLRAHPARTLSHQRQVQATVQNRLQNMRANWNRIRSGEVQFGSAGHSVESSRPGSAAGGSSSTPRLGYGGRSTSTNTRDSEAPITTSQTTRGAGRPAEAPEELERAWANMGRAIRLVGSTANTSASRVNLPADRKSAEEVKPLGTPVSARTRERSHQADLVTKANSSRGPLVERTDSRTNSCRGTRDERHPHHVDSHQSKIDSSLRGGIDLFNPWSSNSRDFNCREQSSRQQGFAGRASENGNMEILGGGDSSRSGYNLRESNRQNLSRTGNNPKDNAVTAGSARSPTSILDEKDNSRGSGGVTTRRFVREAKELQCTQGLGILDDKDNNSRGPMTRWRESLHGRSILDDKDHSNSNSRGSIGPITRREADRIRSKSLSQDRVQPGPRNSSRDEELKAMKEQCCSLVQVALKPSLDKGAIDKVQFKELARSATHTILSSLGVPGLKHGTDVVAVGTITCDHEQPISSSLIPGCCTSCVQRHVKKYVKSLVKAQNTFA